MPFHAAKRSRFVVSAAAVLGLSLLASSLFAAAPAGALSGRVTADGKPAVGARVRLYLDDYEAKPRAYRELSTVEVGDDGAYEFVALAKGGYLLAVERAGSARTFRFIVMEEESKLTNDFILHRPVSSSILVRDVNGNPIVGATLRALERRDDNGEFWLRSREEWKTFGPAPPASDETGRLRLPEFPDGAKVTATIDRPDLAPVRVKDAAVGPPVAAEVVMKSGVRVEFRFTGAESDLADVEVRLVHEPFDNPSSIYFHRVPVADGVATVSVEPGRYSLIWLQHENYYITPQISPRTSTGEFIRLGDSGHEEFRFAAYRKIKVRGRVVDDAGQPLAGSDIQGEVPNVRTDGTAPADCYEWMHADWGKTGENGEYAVELVAGRGRVSFHGDGYVADQAYTAFEVAADGSTVAPEIRVHHVPKVTGVVLDPQGRPAANVVVRLRGGLSYMQPVLTDERGRFELAPSQIPNDRDTEEPRPIQPLVAFHPYERLSARADVNLNDPDSLKDITLTLSPHEPGALIADFADELTPWQRGEVDPERAAEMQAATLRGKPAPPLDGTWLNVETPSEGLAAFRGKYVLLDFWFIGCGPCHADFPSVKLLHDLYKDKGLVVVAVHNDSETAEAVRAFAERQGMNVPILVDDPDGRTTARYEGHGLSGYPSHILIAPDGTIADDDRTTPGPSLRTYKIELIRELFLDQNDAK